MTRRRVFLAVTVLVAAFLIAPEAAVPVFNAADFLILASPFALIWTLWPLIPTRPDA